MKGNKNRREELKRRRKCSRCGSSLDEACTTINCDPCREYVNKAKREKRAKEKKAIRKLKTEATNEKMYRIMQEKNITIKELAEKVNMSNRSVQRWILNGIEPRYDDVRQTINDYLGETIFEIKIKN